MPGGDRGRGGGDRGRQGVAHIRHTCDRCGGFVGASVDLSQVLLELSTADSGVCSM